MAHPVRILLVLSMAVAMTALVLFAARDRDSGEPLALSPAAAPTQAVAPTATPGLAIEPVAPEWVEVAAGAALDHSRSYAVEVATGRLWMLDQSGPAAVDELRVSIVGWSPSGAVAQLTTETTRDVGGQEISVVSSYLYVARPGEQFQRIQQLFSFRVRQALWSPDGSMLAASGMGNGGQNLRVNEADRTRIGRLRFNLGGSVGSWSADSRFLLFLSSVLRGRLAVWDSETGAIADLSATSFAWSREGARLAFVPTPSTFSDEDPFLEIWERDFANEASHLIIRLAGRPFATLSWSRASALLAATYVLESGVRETLVVDTNSGTSVFRLSGTTSASWSPNGDVLLVAGNRCDGSDVLTIRSDGSDLRNLTSSPEFDFQPRWSPDGEQVIFTTLEGGEVVLKEYSVSSGNSRDVTRSDGLFGIKDSSPDGRFLLLEGEGPTGFCEGDPPQTTTVELLP